MKRRTLLLVALVAAVSLTTLAADKPTVEKQELKTVQVLNGTTFDNTKIDAEFKLVKEELKLPGATYQVDGNTLRIGVKLADVRPGEVLRVDQKSDCPDNTQFRVNTLPILTKKWDAQLKRALTAWTRHRHDDFSAKLREINVRKLAGGARNFDVQLDLSRVSAVRRE